MQFGESIGEPPELFEYVFKLVPLWALDGVIRFEKIRPVPASQNLREYQRAIMEYIRRYRRREPEFWKELANFLDESNPRKIGKALSEPNNEQDLKPILMRALRAKGYGVYPREVPISDSTRADIVGYHRRKDIAEEKGIFGRVKERRQIRWYEFLGVELKTAKRAKDPLYRQARDYAGHFDNSFAVMTPLTVLSWGYQPMDMFVEAMKEEGVGILLANRYRVLGTVTRSISSEIGARTRNELTQKLGLS